MNPLVKALAASVTKLTDRMNAQPVLREATVTSLFPMTVRFDTDTANTRVYGSLANWLFLGVRVLTVQIRHYVWIIGMKGNFFNGIHCWRAMSSSYTVGNAGWSGIPWGTAYQGDGITFSGDSRTFTVPQQGVYQVNAQIGFSGSSATGRRLIRLRRPTDNTVIAQVEVNPVTGGNPTIVTIAWSGRIAGGTQLIVEAYQSSGANLDVSAVGSYTYLSVTRIA